MLFTLPETLYSFVFMIYVFYLKFVHCENVAENQMNEKKNENKKNHGKQAE